MRLPQAALAAAFLLLLIGCSGGKEGNSQITIETAMESTPATKEAVAKTPPRREFIVIREIVRQHELQRGDEKRMEAIEQALKEKFPALPDKGETDEERQIYRSAEKLWSGL